MPRKPRTDALIVFLLLALTYGYFYREPGWNGNSRFALVFAVVREGRLTIDSFHHLPEMLTGDKALFDGHYYSDKAIGTALVGSVAYAPIYGLSRLTGASPPLWVEKYLLMFLVVGVPSALAGSLMYLICLGVGATRARAFVATAAVALGTMAFPFSTIFFGHQLAAALLFAAFFIAFRLKSASSFGKLRLFLFGLLLGLALVTEMTTALIVLALVAYYFHVLWRRRELLDAHGASSKEERGGGAKLFARRAVPLIISPALGGALPLLLMMAYNYACFGSPFSIAYKYLENPLFREGMSRGLMGIGWPRPDVLFLLTAHPAMGLFWQSPVLLASLAGLWFMYRGREYRPEALVAVVALVSLLIINSGYYMWWGGWSFGPRHLVPALPFLCLPLVFVPARAARLVAALAALSVFQMFVVAATAIETPEDLLLGSLSRLGRSLVGFLDGRTALREVVQNFFGYSTIYDYCWQKLLAGDCAWNLGRLFGLRGWMSLLPLAAAFAALCAALFLQLRRASGHDETSQARA